MEGKGKEGGEKDEDRHYIGYDGRLHHSDTNGLKSLQLRIYFITTHTGLSTTTRIFNDSYTSCKYCPPHLSGSRILEKCLKKGGWVDNRGLI